MDRGDLFKLASSQRISRCQISGGACGFYLYYRGFNFCVSEILGQSCQVERIEILEDRDKTFQEINDSLPLFRECVKKPAVKGKKNVEFKVYSRDRNTRVMVFLGKVVERRTKERGNNLKDLLVKAMNDFSSHVADPSTIFLVSA